MRRAWSSSSSRSAPRLVADPSIKLVIHGAGPELGRIRRAVAALELTQSVHFSDWIATVGMPEVYRSADVVVMPSLPTPYWVEQFGFNLVEAMACGSAVVTTASGSIAWVTGGAAVLVPPYDGSALAAAIGALADSPNRRAELGRRARRRAVETYAVDRAGRDLVAAFREASGLAPKGSPSDRRNGDSVKAGPAPLRRRIVVLTGCALSPAVRNNGFYPRYVELARQLSRDHDVLLVYLRPDQPQYEPDWGWLAGLAEVVEIPTQTREFSRRDRVARASEKLLGRPDTADWHHELARRLAAWNTEVVVAMGHPPGEELHAVDHVVPHRLVHRRRPHAIARASALVEGDVAARL